MVGCDATGPIFPVCFPVCFSVPTPSLPAIRSRTATCFPSAPHPLQLFLGIARSFLRESKFFGSFCQRLRCRYLLRLSYLSIPDPFLPPGSVLHHSLPACRNWRSFRSPTHEIPISREHRGASDGVGPSVAAPREKELHATTTRQSLGKNSD